MEKFPGLVELHNRYKDQVACISLSLDNQGVEKLETVVEQKVKPFLVKKNATFDNVTVVGPPTNTPPTIGPIVNQTIDEDAVSGPLALTIGDGETAASALVLSVTSTNTVLLPTNSIVLGGSASNRTVTLTPMANQSGVSAVTLKVSDGSVETSTSFLLTVLPVNDLPMVSVITNQTIDEDAVAGPLASSISR